VLDGEAVIGLVGLDSVAEAVAVRLLDAGIELVVWDAEPAACEPLLDRGAEMADTLGELVERVDVVLLRERDPQVHEELVFGDEGIAAFADDDQILVDLTAGRPETTRRFARELEQACGMAWVDAPASGDQQEAEDGVMIVLAGGHEDDVERVRPVLECFGRRVTRLGEVGAGQAANLCQQMLGGIAMLALAETIAFAERSGVDAERLPEALADGCADSASLQLLGTRMAVRQFEAGEARLGRLGRDIDAAVAAASSAGAAVPLTALMAQLLRQRALHAPADEDPATLVELYSD